MALLALGLLAVGLMRLDPGPLLTPKPYSAAKYPAANKPQVVENYGKLPLSFEANQGQTDGRVNFLSRGSGYSLFLTPTEAVLALRKPVVSNRGRTRHANAEAEQVPAAPPSVVRMKLVGANPSPRVSGLEELPGKNNYFIGNDPSKWRTRVPHYAKVQYDEVYPGVDLVYYGNQRRLEYDLVVEPGADPRGITLSFEGVERLRIDAQGDLVLDTPGGEIRQHKPLVYQEVDGVRREIAGAYVLNGGREVGFQVAAYDRSKPLIIDPVLSYSTYLGDGGSDIGWGIAVDASGNAYVRGQTSSVFPTASPIQPAHSGGTWDAFVTKLNAAGNALVYSTYLGGSGDESSLGEVGIAVDSSGNAYVTGRTDSTDFPTASPIQAANGGGSRDAFVTKLNAAGNSLVYSTYLGGTNRDEGYGIAVDASGNAYVAGSTNSDDFPTASPMQPDKNLQFDVFVAKLNAAGSALVYSTYLGGSAADEGFDIAVDTSGSAYVMGSTLSPDFPTASPIQPAHGGGIWDAFVAKLNAAGSALVYSTYLGGSGAESSLGAVGIAVDSSGNAYVTGRTDSTDFPTASPIQAAHGGGNRDAFVTKLNAAGNVLVYSTYLGGSGGDEPFGIAVDASGNAYVMGLTRSTNFPTANPLQATLDGISDVFVTKLNSPGNALVYSTYLGGNGSDIGYAIAVDASGNAYVTGQTGSGDFPTVNPFQADHAGATDVFIAKISDVAVGCTFSIAPISESFAASGGTGSVAVMAPEGCMWTAASNDSWISITSGESGSGNGTVEYSVAVNTGSSSRTGTMTIAGQTFTATQAGTPEPSALTVLPLTLSFSGAVGDPAAQQALQVGSDAGSVNWSVAATLLNGSGWLTVSPASGTATLAQPATVTAEVDFAALAAGVFQAVITVTDTETGFSAAVPLQAVVTSPGGQLLLDQTAFLFRVAEGGFAPPAQTLRVLNNGTAAVNWSLSSLPSWLTASPASGTAGVGAAQASAITLAANPSGLAAGVLQVLVTVSAPGASNNPQLFSATLQVAPTATPATADISPNGMLFVAEQDGALLAEQDLTVSNAGGGTLTADFVAATSSGGDWLMVSPSSGTASGGPFTTQVSVNPSGLAAGVYEGTITGTFSSGGPQQVDVLLIVTPPGSALRTRAVGRHARPSALHRGYNCWPPRLATASACRYLSPGCWRR